jgi:hypothetical protein
MESTDWIKPGADILVYRKFRGGVPLLYRTKVVTVAAQSFTVEETGDRFNLATMQTKILGEKWSRYRFEATHPDSADAKALYAEEQRATLKRRANISLDIRITGDVENLSALNSTIAALTEWRDYLATEEEK